MAHLAAGFYLGLAVKMDRRIGFRVIAQPVHVIPDQVFHDHIGMARAIAQRPARHGADMLFELADSAAILGPMTRIMHTRRDFIDDQSLRRDEQLYPMTPT
jgi:hypothetical protein